MTISSSYTPTIYTGNGVTTAFGTGFPFAANSDLLVSIIRLSDGAEQILFLNVEYSVSGAGNPAGGTVTTINFVPTVFAPTYPAHPMTSGYQLKIRRSTAQIQPLDLVANDGAPAEALELQLDRTVEMIQELGQTLTDIVLAPGGALITNGSPPALTYPYSFLPFYAGVYGGYHKFRQLTTASPFLATDFIDDNMVWLKETGFMDRSFSALGTSNGDPATTKGRSALQIKHDTFDEAIIALWQGDAAANTGKWMIGAPVTGALSIATLSDDHVTYNEYLRFIRSTLTATSVQAQTTLDMNAKRIGNVGAFDLDDINDGTLSGTTKTIDWTAGNYHYWTMGNNVTFTMTPPAGSAAGHAIIKQDGTGNRTMTLPGTWKAVGGSSTTLSTGANKRDMLAWRYDAVSGDTAYQLFKDW